MTTDTTALQERIARALGGAMECEGTMIEVPEGDEIWCMTHDDGIENGEWCRYVAHAAAAVLPIIAAEVKSAKAEAILMDGFDMAVADRLADAGYTEYAEDEDGGLTWVSAPLGEVLRIVSAAHQPIEDASARAVRSWRAMYQVAEEERDQALAALESDPSDAEVEAAKAVLDSVEYADEPQSIRAALSAARAARRDEENR